MTRISPDHPAVQRLAVAICEGLAAWQEIVRLQVPSSEDGAEPQSNLPSDTQAGLLKPEQARRRLAGMGIVQFMRELRAGKIRHIKNGRCYLIPPAALDEYIKANLVGGDEQMGASRPSTAHATGAATPLATRGATHVAPGVLHAVANRALPAGTRHATHSGFAAVAN